MERKWIDEEDEPKEKEGFIGKYEIRCYNCGKTLKYSDNVPKKVFCRDCGSGSFSFNFVYLKKRKGN